MHDSQPDRIWITVQMLLFIAAFIIPPAERFILGSTVIPLSTWILVIPGVILILAALRTLRRAQRDLAENMTVAPTPIAGGTLIQNGIYGKIRHPMYSAAMLMGGGWALIWNVWSGFTFLVIGCLFFFMKSRYEEQRLTETYDGYAAYRQKVRARFIPRVW